MSLSYHFVIMRGDFNAITRGHLQAGSVMLAIGRRLSMADSVEDIQRVNLALSPLIHANMV